MRRNNQISPLFNQELQRILIRWDAIIYDPNNHVTSSTADPQQVPHQQLPHSTYSDAIWNARNESQDQVRVAHDSIVGSEDSYIGGLGISVA